ncbi:MAG: cvpA [Rhizobacter sp.]|nr:cvpA [Rhizobacter sp.]
MGWVDLTLIAVLVVSIVVGLVRGLVFEVLSLLGWIAAYLIARTFSVDVEPWLPIGAPGSAINHLAAFALTFFASLIVWGLLSRLLRALVHASPLNPIDRVLGAAFGAARALVVMLVAATIVAMTPAARSPAWQQSLGAVQLNNALASIKLLLPPEFSKHLPV